MFGEVSGLRSGRVYFLYPDFSENEAFLCIGISRIDLKGVAELLRRLLIPAHLKQHHAEVGAHIWVCRVELQRFAELAGRFGEPMRLSKDFADFKMRYCLIGFDFQ